MKKWSAEEFSNFVTGVMSDSGWFKLHRALILELGIEAATMLQFLIDFHMRVQQSSGYKWDNGWFYCTVKTLKAELNISQETQTRLLNRLSGKDQKANRAYIDMKKRNVPAKRYVRIRVVEVAETIIDWVQNKVTSHPETPVASDREIPATSHPENPVVIPTIINTHLSLSAPAVTDRPCVSSSPKRKKFKPSKFDFRATDELICIVSTHIKVNCKFNRNEWANQFRLMRERDGVLKADIRRTLEWYGKHIGEEYMPEAFSAAAFRRKFKDGKFASAMRRSKDEDSCSNEKDREMDIACEVRAWMENNLGWHSNQEAFDEDVDKALESLGYGAGAIDYQYV